MAYCERRGATFIGDSLVSNVRTTDGGVEIDWSAASDGEAAGAETARFDAVVICAGIESRRLAAQLGDRVNIYPVKGYSITVELDDEDNQRAAPWVSLLDDKAKIVTSRLGANRFRVAGTAEFNGVNRDIRADRIRPLVEWTRRQFPAINTSRVVPWCGLRPMLPDMMPRVGPGKRQGVFYNTGHGHLGWTLSAATAEIVAAQVSQAMPADRAAASRATPPRTPRVTAQAPALARQR
jgi:D-amino-acid dehydrogenase